MHIAQYKINPKEKTSFKMIAEAYNVSIATLAQCNNCYNKIPIYVQDNARFRKQGYINVPIPNNGGKDDGIGDGWYIRKNDTLNYTKQSSLLAGSGGEVILTINSVILNMPCYPVSLNDSLSIDYTSQTVPYRTEPYINYSNSGPRTVSVAFNLHREMTNSNGSDIDNIINVIQAASYPTVGDSNAIPTSLKVGNQVYISGVITGGITTSYSGPIIDGKYNVYDISFTITEIKGRMIYFADKRKSGSFMG